MNSPAAAASSSATAHLPTAASGGRDGRRKPRILFSLTGSIACYKACFAISRLVQAGFEIRTVATAAALQFIGKATLEGLTGQPVYSDLWEEGRAMDHIDLARWADLALVCPATANTINRLASGHADEALSTLFLAWELDKKPWWIAPAMNVAMYRHPITRESLSRLAAMGVRVFDTGRGSLACGEEGEGRLLEPEQIVTHVLLHFAAVMPDRNPAHVA